MVLWFNITIKRTIIQTGILLVLCVVDNFLSKTSESKVGDLDHPATVEQAVGALQTTVKLQRTLVNILHALIENHLEHLWHAAVTICHDETERTCLLFILFINPESEITRKVQFK